MNGKSNLVRAWRELHSLAPVISGNLWHGRWASVTIIIGSALMVGVLMAFLSMSHGYAYTARNGGSDAIAIVQWSQAISETTSQISREQVDFLRIGASQFGVNELSAEVVSTVNFLRSEDLHRVNLNLRGMNMTVGPQLRDGFKVIEGRLPAPSMYEVMAGRTLAVQNQDFRVGHQIRLVNTDWRVVGIFELNGDAFESELWSELVPAQSMYGRTGYQSIRLRLTTPDTFTHLQSMIAADPRLELSVQTERNLYRAEIGDTSDLILYIGWPLSGMLALGCLAGTFNIMLIVIHGRQFSLRTLFLLGYSPYSIFSMILLESVLLCMIGAVIGILMCWFVFDGMQASTMGKGMVTVTYLLRIDANAILQGIVLAVTVGVLGSIIPAWRSAYGKTV